MGPPPASAITAGAATSATRDRIVVRTKRRIGSMTVPAGWTLAQTFSTLSHPSAWLVKIRGQRMQDVDRPADIQAFAPPARRRGVRVHVQPVRSMPRAEITHGITRRLGRWRDIGDDAPIRPAEPQLAIRVAIDLVALLVDGAMVTARASSAIATDRLPADAGRRSPSRHRGARPASPASRYVHARSARLIDAVLGDRPRDRPAPGAAAGRPV